MDMDTGARTGAVVFRTWRWFPGHPPTDTSSIRQSSPTSPTGRYDLYVLPDGPVRLTVDVLGGQVTEATWPDR